MGLVRGYFQHGHEVSGMSSSGKGTSSGEHSIHKTPVDSFFGCLSVHDGVQVDDGQVNEELLGVTIGQQMRIVVPLASF